MTALSIVQNACTRLAITSPTALFSSSDDQLIQLRNLMNAEGQELSKGGPTDHAWTRLITEKTFSTTAAAVQTGAVPSDFGWYINDTMWNRTLTTRYGGPVAPEEWQRYQAAAAPIALPNGALRFRGGDLLIYPSPTASQTAAYEYVTNQWALTSASVGLAAMTADTDTAKLDEGLVTLGVIWRFLQAKGLDYAEAFRAYQLEVNKAIARDGGRKKHYLGGQRSSVLGQGNIPEGSW